MRLVPGPHTRPIAVIAIVATDLRLGRSRSMGGSMLRIKAVLVGLVVSIVLVGAAPPRRPRRSSTNVHGCDIRASAQSVIGLDWRRWTVAQLGGADTPTHAARCGSST